MNSTTTKGLNRLSIFLTIITFIFTTSLTQAKDEGYKNEFGDTKISTNFVNLIGLGDLNFSIESKFKSKESILLGAHQNKDKNTNLYTGTHGAYIGYRIYPTLITNSSGLSGEYFQLTIGTNKDGEDYSTSVEFWLGKSTYLGSNLGIEFGVGLGRKYTENSTPMVLGGVNLVYSL